ncbi:MAG: sugar ABC transporter ATP-binding protein [Planctomycetes bacterium]|nr:sugar ABC transporter ATP-binding protein [Planctomycetota bacterium]
MSPELPTLAVHHITKRFPGVTALGDVSLDVAAGEVHAIVGENGAGKSTLMKILSGAIIDYDGEIVLRGKRARFSGPRDAEQHGISIMYQELNLVEELSAAANIFLGRDKRTRFGLLDDHRMEAEAAGYFAQLGTHIHPAIRVGDLRVGDQQLVEIAKALSLNAEILIMDEPTSALSESEVRRLFDVVRTLKGHGVTVLYISHKMDEVFELADRITVLRDGRLVQTVPRTEADPRQVINLMVGREIASLHFDEPRRPGEVVLRVEGLTLATRDRAARLKLDGVSFELRRGEILGVAGLLGAGRTELLECLFGASPILPRGKILLDGRPVLFRRPSLAMAAGLAFVTEDRKRLGLFDQMTLAANVTISKLGRILRAGLLSRRKEFTLVGQSTRELGIRSAGPDATITSLSGGNQQKSILARWLLTEPKVLLLDEPTRGIDVGAKAELYVLMDRLCRQGLAIVMTSSELPELLTVCDRIMVLCEGRKTAELARAEATEEKIMHAATRPVVA